MPEVKRFACRAGEIDGPVVKSTGRRGRGFRCSTYVLAYNCLLLQFQEDLTLFSISVGTRHGSGAHTYTQAKHSYT